MGGCVGDKNPAIPKNQGGASVNTGSKFKKPQPRNSSKLSSNPPIVKNETKIQKPKPVAKQQQQQGKVEEKAIEQLLEQQRRAQRKRELEWVKQNDIETYQEPQDTVTRLWLHTKQIPQFD